MRSHWSGEWPTGPNWWDDGNTVIRVLMALALALGVLGVGIQRAEIAAPYSDPVTPTRAQDESLYANSVQRMVRDGEWMTPRVLGRFWLMKPPLLVWAAAASVKVFGWSLWALRLPALLAAAAGCALLFWLGIRISSQTAGWTAMLLLLSNPLWHIFARLCYTDALFVTCTIGCIAILYARPRLDSPLSVCGFGLLAGAEILVKSVGGVLPWLVLAGYSLLARKMERPLLRRIGLTLLITAGVAGPWHVYQIIVHPRWFWADYVETQILQFGWNPPVQTAAESSIVFYGRRLFLTDPFLCVFALVALPLLAVAVRKIDRRAAVLVGVWFVVAVGCMILFRWRNLPYALNTIPPACLLAALWAPSPRNMRWLLPVFAGLVFCLKAVAPAHTWALTFGAAAPLPSVAELRWYARSERPNPLIIASPDDEFFSGTLAPHVQYYFHDPGELVRKNVPHYAYLGITTTVDEFSNRGQFHATYAPRLRAWGLNSVEPLGTAITSATAEGLDKLIAARPEYDYYVTQGELDALHLAESHEIIRMPNGRVFLLSRGATRGDAISGVGRTPRDVRQ